MSGSTTLCDNNRHVMAVGLESGAIYVYATSEPQAEWHLAYHADSR